MNQIKLNNNQLQKLLKDNSLYLSEKSTLQLVKNQLYLNINGEIYNMTNANFHFEKQEIEYKLIIDDIKELVCKHLNLDNSMVIFSSRSQDCFDFIARFDAKNEWNIVVCGYSTAIENTAQLIGKKPDVSYDDDEIGLYKKLGNSAYYFRWFQEI